MDAAQSAEHVIAAIHQQWPQIPIIARAQDADQAHRLKTIGASSAIPETVEASLELCEQLFTSIGFPKDTARAIVDKQRTWQIERISGRS